MTFPSYTRNDELFTKFHALQADMARSLASHPEVIRAWLDAQPRRMKHSAESGAASKSWRTARLSAHRRRDLDALLVLAERPDADRTPLARWLLAAVPVRTYLDIADKAAPSLRALDPQADECQRRLVELRELLFHANYGLAKAAVLHRDQQDYGDRLSAASCGLLDAIDRYVPGAKAARFSYFAGYWIRYHISRHNQKYHSLVAFPIHQHRISRRIERYLAERQAGGRAPPSEAELCSELSVGLDACYWHRNRPTIVSMHGAVGAEFGRALTMEHLLCDPSPEPAGAVEAADAISLLRSLLRTHAPPATRVMLAYACGLGHLTEAVEDYLSHLHEQVRERMSGLAGRRTSQA